MREVAVGEVRFVWEGVDGGDIYKGVCVYGGYMCGRYVYVRACVLFVLCSASLVCFSYTEE